MADLIKQGAALTAPLSGEAQSIKDKSDMMDQYKSATATPAPVATPKPAPSTVDKIKPTAKYGDRSGEQRIDTSSMTKPLGMQSYEKGTDYVPKTGPAILHKGEKVVPKDKNMKSVTDKMKASLSGDDKPKKEIKEMHIRKTANGHHIVKHIHHAPAHHPDEEHSMNDLSELHAHLDQHAGVPNEGEAAPTGADAPAPMTAAPSQGPEQAAPAPMPGA
jgi:hypothetical protein